MQGYAFHIFIKLKFESKLKTDGDILSGGNIFIESRQLQQLLWYTKQKSAAKIFIKNGKIESFNFQLADKTIEVSCK